MKIKQTVLCSLSGEPIDDQPAVVLTAPILFFSGDAERPEKIFLDVDTNGGEAYLVSALIEKLKTRLPAKKVRSVASGTPVSPEEALTKVLGAMQQNKGVGSVKVMVERTQLPESAVRKALDAAVKADKVKRVDRSNFQLAPVRAA